MTVLPSEFVEDSFEELRGDYFRTLAAVKALICKMVTLEKLKERIGLEFPYLKEELEHAHTKDKVITLFDEKHDNFPRVCELRELVYSLDLKKAVKEIDKFNDKRKRVYKRILAKDFPKIEPEAYNLSQNVQVGKNARRIIILKCLVSIHNSCSLQESF